MFKKIFLTVVVLIVLVLGYAATRPGQFRVERSAVVSAPPAKVFPLVNDFHNWTGWSPWEKMDPAMKRTYDGPKSGKGASYAWEGNKKVGKGRMEVLESTPPSKLLLQLDFFEPFASRNTAEFTLVPEGAGTKVTWEMYGPSSYLMKLMGLFCNVDKMIGKDFEAGLSALSEAAGKK